MPDLKRLIKSFCLLGITLAVNLAYSQSSVGAYEFMKKGFDKSPASSQPRAYWWWLNGNVNTNRLREELIEMKNAGITGVDIFDIGGPEVPNPDNMIPAGPAFMGDESLRSIKFAVEEAGKLDMDVYLSVSSSWNAGGSWIKPENAAKTLYFSEVRVSGPKRMNIKPPFPTINTPKDERHQQILLDPNGKPQFYTEVAVLALPISSRKIDTAQIINVSRYFDPETEVLDWKVPKGEWRIVRYICANSGKTLNSPSPNSNGFELDPLDAASTASHFEYFIERLKPLFGGDIKNSALKGLYLASYENSDLLWTPALPSAFRELNGYDIWKFIPTIFTPDIFPEDLVEDFQFDFRKTISEVMLKSFYQTSKEISNKNGLLLISESGGPGGWHRIPVEAIKSFGALDIPRGEFWNKYENHNIGDDIDAKWLVKEIAAASHIYGKKLVEEEAFTSWQNWQEGPYDLKALADRAFCEGMNRVVIHGFSHEPVKGRLPGIAFYAGTHFNDRNTWWSKVKPFNQYLARISFILQNSKFVSDVLLYNGDDVPNLVPPKNTHFKVGNGYDYEVINTDVLLNKLEVENGMLHLPDVSKYQLLYLGKDKSINPLVLKKLEKLSKSGALIIGEKPYQTRGLANKEANLNTIKDIADRLWTKATNKEINANSFKKGIIYSNVLPIQALKEKGIVPDFSYDEPEIQVLDYIHTETEDLDFYFVRNTTGRWISRHCSFRQKDRIPEIWNPLSGEAVPINIYDYEQNQVSIPLSFAPNEAYFIVFKKPEESVGHHPKNIKDSDGHTPRLVHEDGGFYLLDKGNFTVEDMNGIKHINNQPDILEINTDWELSFSPKDSRVNTVKLPQLISWTNSENQDLKYFSGTATYSRNFNFGKKDNSKKVYLDLGNLAEVSDVWLNDYHLGILWTKPFRFDISKIVKEGTNTLKIEICNTWSNRLIGDDITGEHHTQTNISRGNPNLLLHYYIKPNNVRIPWRDIPLRESGLFGPVKIESLGLYR